MDASALTPDEARELAELRRLAYGPAGGIEPEQLARLGQLEERARPLPAGSHQPEPAAVPPVAELPNRHPEPQPRVRPVAVREDPAAAREDASVPPVARASGLRGLMGRRWFVAAIAVAAVAGIVGVVSQVGAPRSDLVLGHVTVEEKTGRNAGQDGYLRTFGIDFDGIEQFEDHRSLTVWAAPATDNRRCLVIEMDIYGIVGVSCTPRGLDPTVDVMIWMGMSDAIVGDLPNGSIVRFVLSGDRVLVWERAADADL